MTLKHPKYKVASLLFSLDNAPSPFRIILDIERYFAQEGCVVSLKAYCGDLFISTICDEKVVARARAQSNFFVDNKLCRYKVVETNITCIAIDLPQWGLNHEEINRTMRIYGAILESEIVSSAESRRYFAIIDMKRDIPSKMIFRNSVHDVVELL